MADIGVKVQNTGKLITLARGGYLAVGLLISSIAGVVAFAYGVVHLVLSLFHGKGV